MKRSDPEDNTDPFVYEGDEEPMVDVPRQTSGSRVLSNRTLLVIVMTFIVLGALVLGVPVVITLFSYHPHH